jgi:predicted enzyme related to lactoylglutathione lyase
MNAFRTTLVSLTLGLAGLATAQAEVSLNGVRVEAKDVVSVARFYQQAFGLKEVQRIENPQMFEVMLNFGTNRIGDIVIKSRPSDDVKDPTAHIVFNVTDMAATVKALKAAGGRMEREPFEFGKTGILIGMGIDPAGNHFELIQQPKH